MRKTNGRGNIEVQTGANLFALKDDLIKLALQYNFKSQAAESLDEHQIQTVCTLNL